MATLSFDDTLSFQIRHTKENIKSLSYDEFIQYKTNCHTVVHIHVIGGKNATIPHTFNPRIIRKFVCLRKLYVSRVRFLHPLFTCPQHITVLGLNTCSQLKTVILNRKMQCISAENCSDLLAIGPQMPEICSFTVINCQKFSTFPRAYYTQAETTLAETTQIENYNNRPTIYLYDTPNARIETLPPSVSILKIKGELNNLPKVFPYVKAELQISAALLNNIYNIISVAQYYTIYGGTYPNKGTSLSLPVIDLLINHVITHNSIIFQISHSSLNTAFAFIIKCINPYSLYTFVAKKDVDFDNVLDILTHICPKYFVPVKGIKFNPKLSLYESVILASLPRFYKCLCDCKEASPIKFSIFCNKMRDAMRQN